jgi:S1-C subfamily serine protease/predicted esterase
MLLLPLCVLALADDFEVLHEKAVKAAVAKVAPSIVQIETTGGTEQTDSAVRGGTGPTTGLVVAADGYIITSSFNFTNRPAAIFVGVPGRPERLLAKVIAADQTRMLTLLKVEANSLPVPVPVPKQELRIGQTTMALGRTLGTLDQSPSVSVGVVSALGRIWGKAVQTDAKVSPVNYGGPLVDLHGRVIGILVPASPRGQDETAGVEWYDAGIGFAIPLEDVNAVLARLKAGQTLKRGLLGVRFKSSDVYGTAPELDIISPDSTAAKAGLKPGDVIVEVNGVKTERQNHLMHALGARYEGDVVSLKVRRGKEELVLKDLKLSGDITAHVHAFLGILAMRDDAHAGAEVRYVFPKGPAETAGVKPGDRLTKLGIGEQRLRPLERPEELTAALNRLPSGTELKLEIKRKGAEKAEALAVRLGAMTDFVPPELPEPATRKQALKAIKPPAEKPADKPADKPAEKPAENKQPEVGLRKRMNAAGDREYWTYVPDNYDPNVSHAVVLWLHPRGKGEERDMEAVAEAWKGLCEKHHLILVCPKADGETGWLASETEAVLGILREVQERWTTDTDRVVAHGMGLGGQFALYLGLNARDTFRGVATTGAALAGTPKDNVADERLAFFLVAGGKDPLKPAIAESKDKLVERKYPVTYREVAELGAQQYFDVATLEELGRWIDSLDRM